MKRTIQRTAAITIGLMLAVGAWAGLETVTHISDLNSSWPLGSDLASTSDDHIRNIKVALKTDFPNINGTAGTAPLPPYAIQGDPNTGMYGVGADDLGFSTGGALRFDLSTSAATLAIPLTVTAANGAISAKGTASGNNNISYLQFLDSGSVVKGYVGDDSAGNADISVVSSSGSVKLVTGTTALSVSSAGAITVAAPTSGTALTVTGLANSNGLTVVGSGTSSQSFGMTIQSGTNSSDYTLRFLNAAATTDYFKVRGDGAIQGGGPVAATLVDMTPDTGTFTATYTGFTAGVTCTATWSRIGKLVMLALCVATGTSNSTGFTMTGLPAAIQPATLTQFVPVGIGSCENAGVLTARCSAQITAASGTITFYIDGSSSFSNTGVKGFANIGTISYLLN